MFGKSKKRSEAEAWIERLRWARNLLIAGYVENAQAKWMTEAGLTKYLEALLLVERHIAHAIGALQMGNLQDALRHAQHAQSTVDFLMRWVWPSEELEKTIHQPDPIYLEPNAEYGLEPNARGMKIKIPRGGEIDHQMREWVDRMQGEWQTPGYESMAHHADVVLGSGALQLPEGGKDGSLDVAQLPEDVMDELVSRIYYISDDDWFEGMYEGAKRGAAKRQVRSFLRKLLESYEAKFNRLPRGIRSIESAVRGG